MRLQQSFFWWIASIAVLPLTLLMLGLTIYGEQIYRDQIGREIHSSLGNISVDIERSLAYERSIMLQVAESAAMKRYLPVLDAVNRRELTTDFNSRNRQLSRFLLSFSNIMQSQGVMRILDLRGNTLMKVGLRQYIPPSFDGFEDIPYAELERGYDAGSFAARLGDLKSGEVNFHNLLHTQESHSVLDGVVPLNFEGRRVGYLVTSLRGEQLDYLLQLAPRLYNGKLSLIEINPDNAARHGRVLYDDDASLLFAEPGVGQQYANSSLVAAVQDSPGGEAIHRHHVNYYAEIFPYPDRLLSWVIMIRVENNEINAPFKQIRYVTLVVALAILLLSLLVAHIGARKIAEPVSQLIANFRAMTRGEKAPALMAQDTKELAELADAFNEMQSNLLQAEDERDRARKMAIQNAKLASIGQLAAGVGHELNNPLNNILSYARLLEKDLAAGREANIEDARAIRDEGKRASVIIQGILNFSRQVPANFAEFNAGEWLLQTVALVKAAAQKKGVVLNLEIPPDKVICGDRGQLQQALINLLMNAIQAAPNNSEIEIEFETRAETYTISVFNPGEAIEEEVMDRLFEPFYTTKDVGEGSGLGLSITLGIIEQHNGALQINNVADENDNILGVVAVMALPINPTAAQVESS